VDCSIGIGQQEDHNPEGEQRDEDRIANRYELVATKPKINGPIHDVPRSVIS